MTRANAALSLPPSDRDELPPAPELALDMPPAPVAPAPAEDPRLVDERKLMVKLNDHANETARLSNRLMAAHAAGDVVEMDILVGLLEPDVTSIRPTFDRIKRGLSRPRQPGEPAKRR